MSHSFNQKLKQLMSRRVVRTGVPFVAFVIGGSYFLKHFASVRYEFRHGKRLSVEEAESLGLKPRDMKSITSEMMKDIKDGKVDQWQNIRGPRPWEDSKTYQEEERQKIAQQGNR